MRIDPERDRVGLWVGKGIRMIHEWLLCRHTTQGMLLFCYSSGQSGGGNSLLSGGCEITRPKVAANGVQL